MNNLPNPCPINKLKQYASSCLANNNDVNSYIIALYEETGIPTNQIIAVFQLFQHYCPDNYIDVGCAALSLMSIPNDGIFIDLKSGESKISANYPNPNKLSEAMDLCNSLKQIIAEIFAPTEPD